MLCVIKIKEILEACFWENLFTALTLESLVRLCGWPHLLFQTGSSEFILMNEMSFMASQFLH